MGACAFVGDRERKCEDAEAQKKESTSYLTF